MPKSFQTSIDLIASSILQVFRSAVRGRDGSRAQLLTITVSLLPCLCLLTVLTETIWKPLQFSHPKELYVQESNVSIIDDMEAEGPTARPVSAVRGAAVFAVGDGNFSTAGSGSVRIRTAVVSKGFMSVLGPTVLAGRIPAESEVAQSPGRPVVITEGLWRESFGSARDAIGRACRVNGLPGTIFGVAPAAQMPFPDVQAWVVRQSHQDGLFRGAIAYRGLVRLFEGVTPAIASQQLEAYGKRKAGTTAHGDPVLLTPIADFLYRDHRSSVTAALWVAGCLLLIGLINCVAVYCFELLRSQREMAIKLAVGSSFRRLMVEVICRQQAYAFGGWLIAALVCPVFTGSIARVQGLDGGGSSNYLPNPLVLAGTLGLAACGALFVALAQFWILRQLSTSALLLEAPQTITGSRKGRMVQNAVLLLQFTIATAMAVAAAVFLNGYWIASRANLGFYPEHVLVSETEVPLTSATTPEQEQMLLGDFETKIRERLPTAHVGAINYLPLDPRQSILLRVQAENDQGGGLKSVMAGYRVVQGHYFSALGIRLVAGRFFDSRSERAGRSCAVMVNQELARRFNFRREPTGQSIRVLPFPEPCKVIGVVSDVRHQGPYEQPGPEFYLHYDQAPSPFMSIVVRPGPATPEALVAMGSIVRTARAGIVVTMPIPMTRLVERRLEPQRNRALTVVTVSALALVMIQLGLYGLVGRTIVSQARRIAVELALGASDLQAVRNSLGFILAVVAAGIAAGDGLALLLLNRWQDTLTKSSGVEPVLVGAISCLIACFALIAFYVACRRVLRLEPAEAFRWEAMTGQ